RSARVHRAREGFALMIGARCQLRSLLRPERLDFGRFRFRSLVTAVQRGLDLLGIEQTDVGRRIADDPEDLPARPLNLLDVIRVTMRHASVEWRGGNVCAGGHDWTVG